MANNSAKVTTGKPKVAGAIYRAPLGTTLPTNATATLADAFVGLGYVSEDGVTTSHSTETENTKAWGGDIVNVEQTGREDKANFTLIESLLPEVLKVAYGDTNVTVDSSNNITVLANNKDLGSHIYVIDMILKGGVLKRMVYPSAKVSETGDVVYRDNQVIAYPITLTAEADASSNTHYEYIAMPTTQEPPQEPPEDE